MRALLLFLSLLLAGTAHADDKTAIVGTWKLVSVVYEDVVTKERTPVLGEHPKGIQIATPEGRWLALVTAEGRPIPRTDAERARALQTMIAYTGRSRRSAPLADALARLNTHVLKQSYSAYARSFLHGDQSNWR